MMIGPHVWSCLVLHGIERTTSHITIINHFLQSDLPFVEIYRAKKFTLRSPAAQNDANIGSSTQPIPLSNHSHSQWNCDGEVIHESDLTIK